MIQLQPTDYVYVSLEGLVAGLVIIQEGIVVICQLLPYACSTNTRFTRPNTQMSKLILIYYGGDGGTWRNEKRERGMLARSLLLFYETEVVLP